MELTIEQTEETLNLIKKHVNEKGNCRVGWAMSQIAGQKFENSLHNMEKVANRIISTGKYLKEPSMQKPGDLNILKNPQYRLTQFNTITVVINIIIAIISAVLLYIGE